MKRLLTALILAVFLISTPLFAKQYKATESRKFGVGVNLGEPLGANARYYFFEHLSGDLTVGYGFEEHAFIVQPSVLFHLKNILDYNGRDFSVVPYFGGGFKTGIARGGQGVAAVRFPVGASWILSDGEFEISVEFAPGIEFNPENEFDATGGVGLRYYF